MLEMIAEERVLLGIERERRQLAELFEEHGVLDDEPS
jgi:hypothetical protein